ncbi:MAG: translation initiation factor IF-3 [Endomicrobia bacterium]|nr:translation initiation factor IF-3 [Endomicrobiia bacterium]MCX7940217.1 translation initiation factor IF-3 [Endomicrobiia bacterium]MDW8055903.1 translation initiation factor IF-3 [Elusimicrobiota bacterium]
MDFRRYRVNQFIRAKEVRVVDENGKQLGIMPLQQALQKAQQLGLDLVEIAPQANPPVCKIIDFSKFKYQQEKKEKEIRRAQRQHEIKEIYLKTTIADHDLETKLNHVKEFLQHSHPTKITITTKGRFSEHFDESSQKVIEKIKAGLTDYGTITNVRKDENRLTLIVEPKKKT